VAYDEPPAAVSAAGVEPSLRLKALADTPIVDWDHEKRVDPRCPHCKGEGTVVKVQNENLTRTYPCSCSVEYQFWEWLLPVLILQVNIKRMRYQDLGMPQPPKGNPILLHSMWPEAGKTALIRCMYTWYDSFSRWPAYDVVSGTGSRSGLSYYGPEYLPEHSLWFMDGLQRAGESMAVIARLVSHGRKVILYSSRQSPEELANLPGGSIIPSAFTVLVTPGVRELEAHERVVDENITTGTPGLAVSSRPPKSKKQGVGIIPISKRGDAR
jgi:hypothetical protein